MLVKKPPPPLLAYSASSQTEVSTDSIRSSPPCPTSEFEKHPTWEKRENTDHHRDHTPDPYNTTNTTTSSSSSSSLFVSFQTCSLPAELAPMLPNLLLSLIVSSQAHHGKTPRLQPSHHGNPCTPETTVIEQQQGLVLAIPWPSSCLTNTTSPHDTDHTLGLHHLSIKSLSCHRAKTRRRVNNNKSKCPTPPHACIPSGNKPPSHLSPSRS